MQLLISALSLIGFASEVVAPQTTASPEILIVSDSPDVAEKNKRRMLLDLISKGVVIVNVKAHVNATEARSRSWKGSGFIVDKTRGLIATNHHVAGNFSVCSYDIKFSNGVKVQARMRYVDPLLDFAILKVDPKELPEDSVELKLSDKALQANDSVIAMGNGAGDEFSTQEGTVFNVFDCLTPFNDQSFSYSGITLHGASGSPIFDEKGEVVGIVYGGKFVSGSALPIKYIKDAISYIQNEKIPPRKSIGVSMKYLPVDELVAVGFLNSQFASDYRKEFNQARGKILTVENVINGFSGAKVFEPGDVLVKVNGQSIGPNIMDLSRIIDTATEPLKFNIIRSGQEKELTVTTDDVIGASEQRLINFIGTVWFEHHDQLTVSIGNRDGGVYFSGVSETSPLRSDNSYLGTANWWSDNALYKVLEIDGKPVKSLKELESMIPDIRKKSLFTLRYIDYMGQNSGLTNFKQVDRNPREIIVRYDKAFDTPKLYEWDKNTHVWKDTVL